MGCALPSRYLQARWLALSIRSGAWQRDALLDRLVRALPPDSVDPSVLAARLFVRFEPTDAPDLDSLLTFLLAEPPLQAVFDRSQIRGLLLDPPVMARPPTGPLTFPLPVLETWKDVGRWLCLFDREIAWFADSWSRQSTKAFG